MFHRHGRTTSRANPGVATGIVPPMTSDGEQGPAPTPHPDDPAAVRAADARTTRPLQHDTRRPPRWLPRALLWITVTVFLAMFVLYAFDELTSLLTNLLIAFFLMLMLDPLVVWFVRRGWRRGVAAGVVLLGSIVSAGIVIALFGNLFIQQLVALVGSIPQMYADFRAWAGEQFDVRLPESDDLARQALTNWGDDVASGALAVGTSILGVVFSALTIGLVVYYLLAAGPRFRSTICAWLPPSQQTEVLRFWEVTQIKVSDFINSRVVLATICAVATSVFLVILDTPYALPLGLFTGIVSQFVPTIGTYIGGALPTAIALTSQGTTEALIVLAFIIAYQQVENLLISPNVTARALEMNPAVSFVSVLAFGSVFGALGAFLALPIVATIQATANTWLTRHELIDSPLLRDPRDGERSDKSGEDSGDGGPPDEASDDVDPGEGLGFFASRAARRRARNRIAAREAARTVNERRARGIDQA